MRRHAWVLVLAIALPAAASGGDDKSLLPELWQRRVVSPDKDAYEPADLLLLQRMRRAEAEDACGFLERRLHGLKGMAVVWRDPKTRATHLRLTKDGFSRYLFLRSQDALGYFQSHDVGYKDAFFLKDMQGQLLFDPAGLLTDAGQTVYDRLLADLEVHYRLPDGTVAGNRAPPAAPERLGAQAADSLNRSAWKPVTEAPPPAQARPADQPPAQSATPQAPAAQPEPAPTEDE